MHYSNRTLAWLALGLFAVGTATGLSAPALLQPKTTAAGASAEAPPAAQNNSAAFQPIPLGTAPNYRAIVQRNQAAVVGITTAGPMNTASQDFGNHSARATTRFFSFSATCRDLRAMP